MIEQDTVRLLRECDAGVQMGMDSLREALGHVRSDALRACLQNSEQEHRKLDREIRQQLHRFRDEGKAPNPAASILSRLKTEVEMAVHDSDRTLAGLMTEGCNMGVESLSRYLNRYKAADEVSKDIAKRLIRREEELAVQLRPYL